MKPIFIIGGSKGGVGKSMISIGVIDTLQARSEKILLIESDTSNPDVWKMYKDELKAELIDLDNVNGWIDLMNACDEHSDATIVINTAARNNLSVTAHSKILNNTLEELKRKLVTLWVIHRQRDSLELLKEYMEALPDSTVHVIRNAYFGDECKFELYNNSRTRQLIEDAGGKSLTFPDLADRVADDLSSQRLSINMALQQLPIGNRAELIRWRNEVGKVLGEVLDA